MRKWDVRTAPLTELVGYLTALYDDTACTCYCKSEVWTDGALEKEDVEKIVKDSEERCKKRGNYNECPQRIAYERVYAACEKYEREAEK